MDKKEFEKAMGIKKPHLVTLINYKCSCEKTLTPSGANRDKWCVDFTCQECGSEYRISTERLRKARKK